MSDLQVNQCMPSGPLLGIDFGTVRVGLAICDREQKIAAPLLVYERQARHQEAAFYLELVKKERVVGLVMGLPVHMSGGESKKSQQVRAYGGPRFQLTQQVMIRFAEAIQAAQVDVVPKIVIPGNGTPQDGNGTLGTGSVMEALLTLLLSEKIGNDINTTSQRTPAAEAIRGQTETRMKS